MIVLKIREKSKECLWSDRISSHFKVWHCMKFLGRILPYDIPTNSFLRRNDTAKLWPFIATAIIIYLVWYDTRNGLIMQSSQNRHQMSGFAAKVSLLFFQYKSFSGFMDGWNASWNCFCISDSNTNIVNGQTLRARTRRSAVAAYW